MESAILRSVHHSIGTSFHMTSVFEMRYINPMNNVAFLHITKLPLTGFANGSKLLSSSNKHGRMILPCTKTSETTVTAKSDESHQNVPTERSSLPTATFPKGFEALITEVCDDTEVAELRLKVGDFEMCLKRNIEAPTVPEPVSPPPPPSLPPSSSTVASTALARAPSPGNSSSEKISQFTNIGAEQLAKLKMLEASGVSVYVVMKCPMVGTFKRGKIVKGTELPPVCKEGAKIKKGKVIGYVYQFGRLLPIRSDVAGEVLKFLYNDGEAIGYGDPLIAVLP